MARFQRHTDTASVGLLASRLILMLSVLALVLFGLVMVYSTSSINAISEGRTGYAYIIRQLIYVAVGVVMALIVYRGIAYHRWRTPLMWTVWIISMVMLVLVPLIGEEIYGAKRWLGIGEFTIQPSEFIKITLLLFTAQAIDRVRCGDIEGKAAVVQIFACVLLPALSCT